MNMTLSSNLKKFRLQKNYTQEYVANALGVSSHTISRWECNITMPDITLLPDIARLYCVSIDDLFNESSIAYENYAQRLSSIFELSHNPEDFIRADLEFKALQNSNELSTSDMFSYGIIHQIMMNYCIENALYWFDKAIEKNEAIDDFYYWKSRMQKMKLCSQLNKKDEIINEQLERATQHPNSAKERCLLLAAYMFADYYETAYKEFISSIDLFPNEWELYIHGGDICKKLHRYDEAFKYWDKAEEIGTTFLDGKYSKAFCYEELEQYDKAYNLWNEIANELKKNGFDIEAKLPENNAIKCFDYLKMS